MGQIKLCVIVLGCLYMSACTYVGAPEKVVIPSTESLRSDQAFGQRPVIISPEAIHQLSPEQEKAFLKYFNSTALASMPRHKRVFKYLSRITSGFNYQDETYTASYALENSEGNCLSLAIVTTALANLANVEIGYQLVDSTPVFQLDQDVVIKGMHIRSLLYSSKRRRDMHAGTLRVDYFPDSSTGYLAKLSDDEYIASYYRNVAADALKEKDYNRAYWLTIESLELDANSNDAYNTLAVIYRRTGDFKRAEDVYQFGIDYLPGKLSLLKNYRILLAYQDRMDDVQVLTDIIVEYNDPSPFDSFEAAQSAYASGDFQLAVTLYERTVYIAPYLHNARLGLAKSYYQVGRKSDAEAQLRAALKNTAVEETRSLYEAKLHALGREISAL